MNKKIVKKVTKARKIKNILYSVPFYMINQTLFGALAVIIILDVTTNIFL